MWGQTRKELSGGFKKTTNNRMELMAVIAGLEALKKDGVNVCVYSDSQYVVKAVELGWLKKWVATRFSGGKKKPGLVDALLQAFPKASDTIQMGEGSCRQSLQQSL
jgi:ribonuclease HI